MIKSQNLLASLGLEIPALEADKEGQLRGGFCAVGASSGDFLSNENCDCNCDCNNNSNCNCNCGCRTDGNCNCDCGCSPTPPSVVTPKPTKNSLAFMSFGFGGSLML